MINCIYQLTAPRQINLKFEDVNFEHKVVVRPSYMSICQADQRYYRGKRDRNILKKKLPMALIHECCGTVLKDLTGNFDVGSKVVLIPNVMSDTKQDGIFENYQQGSKFRSSGIDGFMQELIAMPHDRLITFEDKYDSEYVFAITELLSVAVHAVKRLMKNREREIKRIAVFGDGNVGFLVSLVAKKLIPSSEVIVIGRHEEKLANFSFVDDTLIDINSDFSFDHAFECTGGTGAADAIDKIIRFINPQGTAILMGVSEEKIPINTRNVLEKGLKFIGASRSGFEDFETAVKLLEDKTINETCKRLIELGENVNSIQKIHESFEEVMRVPFKLVFKWCL